MVALGHALGSCRGRGVRTAATALVGVVIVRAAARDRVRVRASGLVDSVSGALFFLCRLVADFAVAYGIGSGYRLLGRKELANLLQVQGIGNEPGHGCGRVRAKRVPSTVDGKLGSRAHVDGSGWGRCGAWQDKET